MFKHKKWRSNSTCKLHWFLLGSDTNIVFNEASGKTHIVSSLCTEAMNRLRLQKLNNKEICCVLSEKYHLDLDKELESYVENMLSDLDRLGLVEPCES